MSSFLLQIKADLIDKKVSPGESFALKRLHGGPNDKDNRNEHCPECILNLSF